MGAEPTEKDPIGAWWELARRIVAEEPRVLRGGLRHLAIGVASGSMGGLLPAWVALGISASAPDGAGAVTGVLRWIVPAGSSPALRVGLAFGGALFSVGLTYLAGRSAATLNALITSALRLAMVERVLHADPTDLLAVTAGPVAGGPGPGPKAPPGAPVRNVSALESTKLTVLRDGQMASELLVSALSTLPQAGLGLVLVAIDLALGGAPFVVGVALVVFLVTRLITHRESARVSAAARALAAEDANLLGELSEKWGHLEDFRILGARGHAMNEAERAVLRASKAKVDVGLAASRSSQLGSLLGSMSPLIVAAILSFWQSSSTDVARYLLALPLMNGRLAAFDALRLALFEKRPVVLAVSKVLGLSEAPTRPREPRVRRGFRVTFDRVSFRPPGAPRDILSEVSFALEEGQTVLLVGPSGSGKSTAARLLLRLIEPTEGAITVGGEPLSALDPDELPKIFGVLTQKARLLRRSLRENLELGASPYGDEALMEALRSVELEGFATVEGLALEFEPAKANVSGGEERRILTARAALRSPEILLLDEPEAGLPSSTAGRLLRSLVAARAGKSNLIVTHSPWLLPSAHVVLFEAGRVVSSGPYAALLDGSPEAAKWLAPPEKTDVTFPSVDG